MTMSDEVRNVRPRLIVRPAMRSSTCTKSSNWARKRRAPSAGGARRAALQNWLKNFQIASPENMGTV
jgi:hypothetical protein